MISDMWRKIVLALVFPLCRGVATLVGGSTERIDRYFIGVNNRMVSKKALRVRPEKLLLLLPHCLQRWECPHKITGNIRNCQRCGNCLISDLIEIADKNGINVEVATGGTLALRAVMEHKPEFIVAVACERDLIAGIREALPYPVWGIFNLRPNGPCRDTLVELPKVEHAIRTFTRDN